MMIFGFLPPNLKTKAVAVAFSIAWLRGEVEAQPEGAGAAGRLAVFRRELYGCFTARADALFALADAVLCNRPLAEPSPVDRREGGLKCTAARHRRLRYPARYRRRRR
jgi:hypothetical protein